jgi:hypothetical protein
MAQDAELWVDRYFYHILTNYKPTQIKTKVKIIYYLISY